MAKKAATKNALDPLKIKAQEKPVKLGEVLTLLVEGDYPFKYNEASSIVKSAEQLMKDLKPAMLPVALEQIFAHNAQRPWEPITSVAFQDDTGNATRVTFVSKYSEVPAEVAENLFATVMLREQAGQPAKLANINDYLARTVKVEFNSEALLNSEGKLEQERYDKILAALDKVSKELGIANPLSATVSVKPLPTFPARRWIDFDAANNLKISKVITNQINFVPCPPAAKAAGEEEK